VSWAEPPVSGGSILADLAEETIDGLTSQTDSDAGGRSFEVGEPTTSGAALRGQIARAALALVVRQGFVKIVGLAGVVVLARILDPSTFGAFAIVSFVVALFTLVGDMGLAAALIQQVQDPSERELSVAFTGQMLTLGLAASLVWLLSPLVISSFGLSGEIEIAAKLLAIGLIVSSLRTIPSTRLERRLKFGQLAVAEGAQVVVYQVVAVALAVQGFGVVSFAIAAVGATAANTLLVNWFGWWRPKWGYDRVALSRMLRFGAPYQASAAISFIKDAVNPLFVGVVIGAAAVGYVNWAIVVMGYPLLLVGVLNRLYFPAFARLRSYPDVARQFADTIIRWSVFAVVGLLVPYLLAPERWTRLIFGAHWLPGVPLLYWLAIAMPFAAAVSVGLAIMNAYGRSDQVLFFTILWMVGTWGLTVPAVLVFGWIGFGVANAFITLIAPFFLRRVQESIPIAVFAPIARVIAAAMLALSLSAALPVIFPSLAEGAGWAVVVTFGSVLYGALWIAFSARDLAADRSTILGIVNRRAIGADS